MLYPSLLVSKKSEYSKKLDEIINKYEEDPVVVKMRKNSIYIHSPSDKRESIMLDIVGNEKELSPLIEKINKLGFECKLSRSQYTHVERKKVNDDDIGDLLIQKYPDYTEDELYENIELKVKGKVIFGIKEVKTIMNTGIIHLYIEVKSDKYELLFSNLEEILSTVCKRK